MSVGTQVNRDIETLLDKVFQRVNPVAKLEELLNSDDNRISAGVLLKLMEYRYGKPRERTEISGSVNVAAIIAEARQRVASLNSLPRPLPATSPLLPENPAPIESEVTALSEAIETSEHDHKGDEGLRVAFPHNGRFSWPGT
jgi:hypothetical protein